MPEFVKYWNNVVDDSVQWAVHKFRVQYKIKNVIGLSGFSRCTMSFADERVYVYHKTKTFCCDNCVMTRDRFGGRSVMLCSLLTCKPGPYPKCCAVTTYAISWTKWRFQQDNAQTYSARLSQDCIKVDSFDVTKCPAVSPEHTWNELGRRMCQLKNTLWLKKYTKK